MAHRDDARIEMSAEELHLLRDLFQQASGFLLRQDMKFIAERRLATRLEVLGLEDFRAYHRYLRFDPRGGDELEAAIELLVPHETYFFREPAQLDCFTQEILPELAKVAAPGRPLRFWSAGCSTGEEPYTIAMLLDTVLGAGGLGGSGLEVDVLGTDLSRRSLTAARHAEYGTSALRSTTPAQKQRFFDELPGGRVRVKDEYRARVRFGQLNLIDQVGTGLLPLMDVVFCRNVLIYFEAPTRKKVVDLFYDQLRPGGLLLLGHSENLFSLSTRFELAQLERDLVYRRPPS